VFPEEETEDSSEEETATTQEGDQEETSESAENADETENETDQAEDSAASADAVSLSEALGLTDIKAVYTGAEISDHYDSVVPESGKELLILHVTLQNNTGEEQPCDLMTNLPIIQATVNGTVESTAELTILTENLATWEEPIAAGASEDAVILFQVKQGQITSIDQLELSVTAGDRTSRVVFL
jgi:hypothetical protein